MKKLLILIGCLSINLTVFAQIVDDVDEISTFYGEYAAIKKGDLWGFINKEGVLVVDYRNDLVKMNAGNNDKMELLPYPVFRDGRCLMRKLIDDVYYYGYIDETGNEIIPPQYLNASNFENGKAIIIQQSKEVIGFNEVLKKDVISSNIEEYIIDTAGEIVKYLENPRNLIPSKTKNQIPPKIYSKFISPQLIAVMKKDNKWDIYKY